MATRELERAPVRTDTRLSRVPFAWISAAAFAISSAWFALIVRGVTQGSAPEPAAGASLEAMLEVQYGWFATTLAQERIVTGIAIVGFAAMIVSVWAIRERLGSARVGTTAGAILVSLGSAVWIVGNVIQAGGHRAVGLMATHDNPIEVVNSIAFTVDMIDDAFELAAFTMLGIGVMSFAVAGSRVFGSARWWSRFSAAFAVVLVALGGTHAAANGDVANLLLVVVGVALTPAWLLWADRLGRHAVRQEPGALRG